MTSEKVEEGMLVTQEGMLLNKIDIQAILQLLVEKEIISREEVSVKRDYVSRQPLYKNSLDAIHKLQIENREGQRFVNEFEKFLQSEGKSGDSEYLRRKLENMTENK